MRILSGGISDTQYHSQVKLAGTQSTILHSTKSLIYIRTMCSAELLWCYVH